MKQLLVACIALLLISCSSNDQRKVINVTGTVSSTINLEPVEGLTVSLKKNSINNGWGVVQNTTTDSEGKFEIFYGAMAPGNYRIDINSFPDQKTQCGSESFPVSAGLVEDFSITIDTDASFCQ